MSLLALLVAPAFAVLPLPIYPECGAPYAPELCPSDLRERWWMISYIPAGSADSIRPAELELGSGAGSDRAFALSTGRWDVMVAVADSGIRWDQSDVARKVHLNVGELPLPQDAEGQPYEDYDVDGNGLVNISDYAADPRVRIDAGVDRADHMLDASDLIAVFSDGSDDDDNGYTDDIAGWDFFAGDNDPYSDFATNYGEHGTGVMQEAAAEGGDGGWVGTCPNCAVLPVRIGDTFITDGTRAGQGVAFAVDSGASVVAMAVGALSHSDATTEALEYAHDSGVLVVAAAGDENAYHHNMPAMYGEVMYVHSVRADNGNEDNGVYSFTNFFNCNNYGPRVDLVAGSGGCATGSVAVIAGVAGQIKSAARDRGVELSATEVRQLLVTNAQDIWLSQDELDEARTYPSSEGWDPFYGYGRVNAGDAVEAVVAGDIPPEARIDGVQWFDYFDPEVTPALPVTLVTAADRASSYTWALGWGQGWEPTTWTEVHSGSGSSGAEQEVTIDLSEVPRVAVPMAEKGETVLERVARVHGPALTLRLRVTDDAGRVGEARRTVWVHHDEAMLPGFPFRMDGSGEPSAQLFDLDGDGVMEIITATGGGRVYVLGGDGQLRAGWPALTDPVDDMEHIGGAAAYASGAVRAPLEAVTATPAIGDVDGDGQPEVVVAGLEGGVYAFTVDGQRLPGFPVAIERRPPEAFDSNNNFDDAILGAPTLVDLEGDGALEIVVGGGDSRLYVFAGDGSLVAPYPIEVCHPDNCGLSGSRIVASPAVGDIDGDGDPDFVLGSNETARGGSYSVSHAYDALTGQELEGWPQLGAGLVAEAAILPIVGEGHPGSAALVDIDGDGDLEVFDPYMLGQIGLEDHLGEVVLPLPYAADAFGPDTDATEPSFIPLANSPAIGDLDGDGVKDLFLGGSGTFALVGLALTTAVDFHHVLGGWSGADGAMLQGWPRSVEDLQFLMSPSIADISGDGLAEVIYASGGYMVHAWDASGASPEGWPHFTGQWVLGTPTVGDVNGDGYLDVVTTTREGFVFAWSTAGPADGEVQWRGLHHDARNTSNAEVPLETQEGPPDPGKTCGCASGGRTTGLGPLALLALLAARRRRTVRG